MTDHHDDGPSDRAVLLFCVLVARAFLAGCWLLVCAGNAIGGAIR